MSRLDGLRHRMRTALRRQQAAAELEEEIGGHLAFAAADAVAEDPSRAQSTARWVAARRFGHAASWSRRVRERWSVPWLDTLVESMSDVRRRLRRHRVLSMAMFAQYVVAIGAIVSIVVIGSSFIATFGDGSATTDRGSTLGALVVIAVAAAFLLLTTIANGAVLALARGLAAGREVALRAALGASPRRLARAALGEGIALALLAAPVGLALATFVVGTMREALPTELLAYVPGWEHTRVGAGGTLLAGALALLAGGIAAIPAALADRRIAATCRDALSVSGTPARPGLVLDRLLLLLVALGVAQWLVASAFARGAAIVQASAPAADVWRFAAHHWAADFLAALAYATVALGTAGLLGTLFYAVTRRERSIAIRFALGAPLTRTWGAIVGSSIRTAGIGTAAGVLIALGCDPLLRTLTYGARVAHVPSLLAVLAALGAILLLLSALAWWRVRSVTILRQLSDH